MKVNGNGGFSINPDGVMQSLDKLGGAGPA